MNGSAEGFADYGVVIDPDRNWLASVMERAQRTINILLGASMEREKWPKGERGGPVTNFTMYEDLVSAILLQRNYSIP